MQINNAFYFNIVMTIIKTEYLTRKSYAYIIIYILAVLSFQSTSFRITPFVVFIRIPTHSRVTIACETSKPSGTNELNLQQLNSIIR